jgi:hypothetical protein
LKFTSTSDSFEITFRLDFITWLRLTFNQLCSFPNTRVVAGDATVKFCTIPTALYFSVSDRLRKAYEPISDNAVVTNYRSSDANVLANGTVSADNRFLDDSTFTDFGGMSNHGIW